MMQLPYGMQRPCIRCCAPDLLFQVVLGEARHHDRPLAKEAQGPNDLLNVTGVCCGCSLWGGDQLKELPQNLPDLPWPWQADFKNEITDDYNDLNHQAYDPSQNVLGTAA